MSAASWLACLGVLAAGETSTIAIERVDVEAEAEAPEAPADPTQRTTRIGRGRIRAALSRGEELDEIVDSAAGTRVIDLGGPVQPKRLSIRGGSAAQSALIVDGVPMSSPFATGFDLGLFALEDVDHIDVVRGGAGAMLGDGALTGAMLVTTRPAVPGAPPHAAAALRYGTLGTVGVSAGASSSPLSAGAELYRSDGAFSYVSRLPQLPDEIGSRDNNDATRGGVTLRLDTPLSDGTFTLAGGGAVREAGLPGSYHQESVTARELRGSARLRAGWRRPGLAIGAHAALLAIDYEEPDLLRLDASTTRFWSGGADAAWETLVFDRHLIAARAEAAGEASRSTEHGDLFRARGAIALSGEGDFDPWIAFAAMRLQIVTDFGLEVLPRAGVRFEATPDLSFVLAAGRSMRVPALDELHHPSEPGLEGNPALAPETAWEVDLSADVTFGESSASASVFARTIEDAILYVHRNAFVIRPENLGAARAVGGEIESQLAFELAGARVDTELCASLFLGELSVTRVPLPGQPAGALEGSLAVAPRIGAERPLELFTRVRWSSPTSTNVHGTLDVNAYTRWDAGLTYRVASQWAASILVTNVLDDRTLETVLKIPLPGRMVLASIRVTTPEEETEAAEP